MRYEISETQRALKIKRGKVMEILDSGTHWTWNIFGKSTQIWIFDILTPEFITSWSNAIVSNHPDLLEKYFVLADPNDKQVAIVSKGGKFYRLLEPGQRILYWNVLEKITVEYVDISDFEEIPAEKVRTLIRKVPNSNQFLFTIVPESHVGILYVDGKLIKTLEAGSYAYWKGRTSVEVSLIDLRLQNMEISGQEILTKDRVSLRLNFEAFYKILDPELVATEIAHLKDYLYKEFQFVLRKYIGTRTLDEILSDKESISEDIESTVSGKMKVMGIELKSTGVKDVILPGDMKNIMNQVVSAEKAAQANLIRRREEVAATRSLLNTAKMIESNPVLMRLKELEALEKVADKVESINVGGNLAQILDQVVVKK